MRVQGRTIPITPDLEAQFREQRQRFLEKFGREPGPKDPVFFDPDASEPREMSIAHLEAETLFAMEKAGIPPDKIYAYKKTGIILTEANERLVRKEDREAWYVAVEEYRAGNVPAGETGPPN